jgi:hypothetical protein
VCICDYENDLGLVVDAFHVGLHEVSEAEMGLQFIMIVLDQA